MIGEQAEEVVAQLRYISETLYKMLRNLETLASRDAPIQRKEDNKVETFYSCIRCNARFTDREAATQHGQRCQVSS